MFAKNYSLRIIASSFAAVFWMTPASADTFKPLRFLQDASVVAAIATAVAQLNSCEEDLVFSEEKKKEDDGEIITVIVACNKFPDDDGKLGRSTVRVDFELNTTVGAPLGFSYPEEEAGSNAKQKGR